MYPDGITLTEKQRERADRLLERCENYELHSAKGLVNEWKPCPVSSCGDHYEEIQRWVSLSNVIGTKSGNVGHFKHSSIKNTLVRLLDGRFQTDFPKERPQYIDVDGELYVWGDGNHRTMVCKAVGIDELYADVLVASSNQ